MTIRVSVRALSAKRHAKITTPKNPDPLFQAWIIRLG